MTRPATGASLVIGALLLAAATVGAATITGTAGNDTLRGSPAADRLAGRGGNDRLFGAAGNDVLLGGAGNDLLVGGSGADKLSCGTGRDTVRGDLRDRIAADCEVVKNVPTPPASPPPTPPYSGSIAGGSYQGRTENGNLVFLTVGPDRTFTGWMVVDDLPNDCGYVPGGDWLVDATFRIGEEGTFDVLRSGGSEYGRGAWNILYERGQVVDWKFRVAGRFDSATSVSGTISMDYELEQREAPSDEHGIVHLHCSTGAVGWSATLRPPEVAPVTAGSYRGQTETGNPVFLTVRPDRTFTGWMVLDDLPNNCGYVPGGDWFADTTFSIRNDGTFDAQPSWSGSIIPYEGGELNQWEGRIAGRSDTATSLSGSVFMNYRIEDSVVGALRCSTRYVRWSATLSS
jgi:hypothetical protein